MVSEKCTQTRLTVFCDVKRGGRKYLEDVISIRSYKTQGKGDYLLTEKLKNDLPFVCFFVFDGHGGVEAAKFAEKHLMNQISIQDGFYSEDDEVVMQSIKDGFMETHKLMWEELDSWPKTCIGHPSTAGTTVSMVMIRKKKLYVAHVGDSTVVVGLKAPVNESRWVAKVLTEDHKPENSEELSRIKKSGGEVVVKAGVPRVVWKRDRSVASLTALATEPTIEKVPFLAIARSLGDLWSYEKETNSFAVSPEPDVSVHDMDTIKCIVLASDGLWNVLSAVTVVGMVQDQSIPNPNNVLDMASHIVDSALSLCESKSVRADNVSAIVILAEDEKTNTADDKQIYLDIITKPKSCLKKSPLVKKQFADRSMKSFLSKLSAICSAPTKSLPKDNSFNADETEAELFQLSLNATPVVVQSHDSVEGSHCRDLKYESPPTYTILGTKVESHHEDLPTIDIKTDLEELPAHQNSTSSVITDDLQNVDAHDVESFDKDIITDNDLVTFDSDSLSDHDSVLSDTVSPEVKSGSTDLPDGPFTDDVLTDIVTPEAESSSADLPDDPFTDDGANTSEHETSAKSLKRRTYSDMSSPRKTVKRQRLFSASASLLSNNLPQCQPEHQLIGMKVCS